MIGIGKWKFNVDTMFYRGEAFLVISEKDGAPDIELDLPGQQVPDFAVSDLAYEGNTVTGNIQTSMLKGKNIPFSCTFEGDTANGFLKIPFIGKVKLNNGERVG